MSFLSQLFEVEEGAAEQKVCCPFYHKTSNGIPYKESVPSAHVNTEKGLFHCKACNTGLNELQFIQKFLGCDFVKARKLQRCFETEETREEWVHDVNVKLSDESIAFARSFNITEPTLNQLDVSSIPNTPIGLAFPVFMFDQLCDIRKYNPAHPRKVLSREHCPAGLVIPFDIWCNENTDRTTIICAGEKDMAVARSYGFNAITITGGEMAKPLALNFFENRDVIICYDNDDAGLRGAKSLALFLQQVTNNVGICTEFHKVCVEEKEDVCDFFTKYGKTREDFIACLEQTEIYVPTEEDLNTVFPQVDLITASNASNVNKLLQSNIQVVAVSESAFVVPTAIEFKKFDTAGRDDTMPAGTVKDWGLEDNNVQDLLHLFDNNFTERQIKINALSIARINPKERCVKQTILAKTTVFKAYVTDLFETSNTDSKPMEYTVYSIGKKLNSGEKYKVTFKLVPHPYKGNQLVMMILDAKQASDSVSNFKINEKVKTNLKHFQDLQGTVEERIHLMTEKVKGLTGYDGNNTLISALDLSFHTPLEFNFGRFKNIRAYLDTIIVSESRLGKSSTAEALRKSYLLGAITSLAGNSATTAGLIGGSNKSTNGFQTRAGLIPQNHKGLIIFEEFGKSSHNLTSELTDIRSSNEVRISRVSGTITLPALVRMIALTNVKATGSSIKSIASYPNGISIITELVNTAEDIARYDLIVILADKGNGCIDPLWTPQEPFSDELYQTRIRWIWSRTSDQIILSDEVSRYIIEQANELNASYECHIKIFGTEAWKKLARVAIAVAGYLVSTDETYKNIVVLHEHVNYAVQFLKNIYDNRTFKLKEFVNHEKKFSQIDDEGVANLQDIYNAVPVLILQLEQMANCNKNTLSAATGLENIELNKALNRLTKGLFIRFIGTEIIPTERFRLGLNMINRNTQIGRVGEC